MADLFLQCQGFAKNLLGNKNTYMYKESQEYIYFTKTTLSMFNTT